MRKFIKCLMAVTVATVMVFGYLPEVGAASTVPQNVQVPMPIPTSPDDLIASQEWWASFVNSFFPDRPDVFVFGYPVRISAVRRSYPPPYRLLRFHVLHYDNTLWAWGENNRGYLGDGTTINRHTPVLILDNVFRHISYVSSNIALRYDGTLWSWGAGDIGTLGVYPRPSYRASPGIIKKNVVAISGTSTLRQDGTVWVWGTGVRGSLGCGASVQTTHYTPIKILDNVVKFQTMAVGGFALRADGSLWAWGTFERWDSNAGILREVFRAYTPTMIVRNFIEPTTEIPHMLPTFISDDGAEFTWHGWAPQLRPVDMLLDPDDWVRDVQPTTPITRPDVTPIPIPGICSPWARPELEIANGMGLIPSQFLQPDIDLREPITREEFAAVVVYLYENLAITTTQPVAVNPFTDTNNPYVLRALSEDIAVGISPTLFDPYSFLTREMAATGLTRAFKRTTIPGWTYETDEDFPLNFDWGLPFADDHVISRWARESVYFMAVHNIIGPGANNMFNPRALTPAQEAIGFATTTREQALIIALRMVDNFGF